MELEISAASWFLLQHRAVFNATRTTRVTLAVAANLNNDQKPLKRQDYWLERRINDSQLQPIWGTILRVSAFSRRQTQGRLGLVMRPEQCEFQERGIAAIVEV